jgi:hypothetical protein
MTLADPPLTRRGPTRVQQRIKQDERDLQAHIVVALNRIQEANERMRAALLDGDLDLIVLLAQVTADQAVTLVSLATL